MPAIQCPTCGAALEYDPNHGGLSALCPICQGPFKVPMPPQSWSPPPIAVAEPKAARRPPSWWAEIHWTKKLMLVATVLWPVACFGVAFLQVLGSERFADERMHVANGMVWDEIRQKPVPERDPAPMIAAAMVGACFGVTLVYFLMLFVLFVLWFATRP